MKKAQLHSRGLAALQRSLGEVPFIGTITPVDPPPHMHRPDACLRVDLSNGHLILLIEMRSNGQPRHARSAVNRLQEYLLMEPDACGILIAPYISPASAEICAQAGVGYLDLAGNCRLTFQQVYIHRQGRPNPFSRRRELASLYSPAAGRILRTLLEAPFRPWKTLPLAETAQVSPGMITRVRKLLAGEGWVHTGPEGFALTQPQSLLSDWAEQVDVQRNPLYRYHTPTNDIRAALAALAEVCNRQNIPWALTGPSAAARLLQQPVPRPEMVCIQGDVPAIAQVLGLRPSDEESDELLLIETRDAGVFIGKTQSGPWPLISPLQAVLDLQYLPQPAPLVNALIENYLMPRWTQCKEQFQT